MLKGDGPDKVVLLACSRGLLNGAKEFLIILEDLKSDGVISEEYYQKLRRRILSRANDSIREFESLITNFDIQLK